MSKLSKFKFGDIIIGNELASCRYMATTEGTRWLVIFTGNAGMVCVVNKVRFEKILKKYGFHQYTPNETLRSLLMGSGYTVDDKCFDYIGHYFPQSNKANKNLLMKLDD